MFASKDLFFSKPSGYQISRSVRTRASATAYFNRTQTAGSQTTWTWSAWVKLGNMSGLQYFFDAGGSSGSGVAYNVVTSEFQVEIGNGTTQYYARTSAAFRDPSAWYHIVAVADTSNATSTNRLKLYVNGVQQTIGTSSYPTSSFAGNMNQNTIVANIGRWVGANYYFDGYLTEVNFIDGQALTPSSFGQTNTITGVWQPLKYTGTYGTNGFYLNFSDNSAATATTIGKDYSGNGNNWTPNNISVTAGATYDSMLDVPTLFADGGNGRGNYAVLNPIGGSSSSVITVSNGNLTATTPSGPSNFFKVPSSIAVSSGKWYFEDTVTAIDTNNWAISIAGTAPIQDSSNQNGLLTGEVSYFAKAASFEQIYVNGSVTFTGTVAASVNDVIGVSFDADARTIQFYRNNSAVSTAQTINSASTYYISCIVRNSTTASIHNINFGQRPFTYTPPTGFVALNTQNLPTPTISNGANYMAATTYTGNGTTQSITNTVNGISFQPDFVWFKSRSAATGNGLYDSIRGVLKNLSSESTAAESTVAGTVTAFNSNGFSVGNQAATNTNGATYIGWQWKAGTTSSSNTDGSITSTVSVGATQGFSVMTFTGTGANATVGHGLGVAPSMIIAKRINGVQNWLVGSTALGWTKALNLDLTDAAATTITAWNNTAPTSSVFSMGTFFLASTYVAYCFSEVAGYSKFGSYTGNGSADGPFVFCGFRPRWVMIKGISSASDWVIFDTSRDSYNMEINYLVPNTSGAEASGASVQLDGVSNGIKIRGTWSGMNGSGNTFIFAAFAENPTKFSLAR